MCVFSESCLFEDKVSGKIGYAISYNLRKITEELREYEKVRDETINKLGIMNEQTQSISIETGSDAYKDYLKEMEPYDSVEHEINILKIKLEDLYESISTGKEMLTISFMTDEEVIDNQEG